VPSFGLLGHAPYFLGKDEEGSTWYFYSSSIMKLEYNGRYLANLGRLKMLHQLCSEYKSYTKLWLGPAIMWILINDPRSIQKILLSPLCLEKPFFYKFLRLENGLISAKCKVDAEWRVEEKHG
jgi:cytochrome P450 family 4